MHFLRKASLGLVASLFVTLLSTFGILFAAYQVFSTPSALKRALNDSGVYKTVVGNALDQAQKEQPAGDSSGQIPVNDPAIRSVIQEAASPAFLQIQSEDALDAVYAWLQGKTPHLTITVELADVKTRLANGLGEYVQQRLATLPACGPGASADNVDPFTTTCVPAGLDTGQLAAEAKDQIQNGEFLKDTTTLTADSIKTEDGKTLEQQLKAAPVVYQRATWAIYGLAALLVLLALGVLFLSDSRRSGLKKLGIIFMSAGTTSAVLAWLSSFGLKVGAEQLAKMSGGIQPLQQSLIQVAQLVVNDIRAWWMGYGIVLAVLGLGTLLALRLSRPKVLASAAQPQEPQNPVPTPSIEPAQPPTPNNKPKPRPVKKLVQ